MMHYCKVAENLPIFSNLSLTFCLSATRVNAIGFLRPQVSNLAFIYRLDDVVIIAVVHEFVFRPYSLHWVVKLLIRSSRDPSTFDVSVGLN